MQHECTIKLLAHKFYTQVYSWYFSSRHKVIRHDVLARLIHSPYYDISAFVNTRCGRSLYPPLRSRWFPCQAFPISHLKSVWTVCSGRWRRQRLEVTKGCDPLDAEDLLEGRRGIITTTLERLFFDQTTSGQGGEFDCKDDIQRMSSSSSRSRLAFYCVSIIICLLEPLPLPPWMYNSASAQDVLRRRWIGLTRGYKSTQRFYHSCVSTFFSVCNFLTSDLADRVVYRSFAALKFPFDCVRTRGCQPN